jgi:predicted Zn-dependent protease
MKTKLLLLSLLVISSPLLHGQQNDVVNRAMRDEMQRSLKELHLESMDPPYYIAYKIVDSDRKEAQASFGSLTSSGETRNRILTVTVRVGTYDFDNSNFTASGGGVAALFLGALAGAPTPLPIDDNYEELRRKIWIATDSAYKKAVEDLSGKKAALQNRNHSDDVPDFSKTTPRQESETLPPIGEKLTDAEHLVRAASAVFRTLPLVETSAAQFEVINSTEYFLNSEGTSYTRQVPDLYFHASASMQNDTGEIFSDSYSAYGRSLSELPSESVILQESKAVADRLSARRRGHAAKRYNGPVLLEGDSAAELFAHHFGNLLSAHPHSGGNNNSPLAVLLTGPTVSLANRVGSRVLPDFLTVIDNPQLTQAHSQNLFGNYKFDEEGTPSQETVLIKDGVLKTLLTSRAPARGMLVSTGNMRERGVLPGNVFVNASKSSSREELRKQLVELVKTRSLEYGMIIRRLAGNTALEAVRIYPDGHEEAVRDARVAEITAASFKDILAVSKDQKIYTERAQTTSLLGLLPFSTADLVTYVVPDLLFEDMTVEHVPNDTPKLPVVPSPLASN